MDKLIEEIKDELTNARIKFPGKNVTFAALVEEVGELATAMFSESRERVREEAVQVAVMAMRVVLDGDHTFDAWRESESLDSLVKPVLKIGSPEWCDQAEKLEWGYIVSILKTCQERSNTNISGLNTAIDIARERSQEGWRNFGEK